MRKLIALVAGAMLIMPAMAEDDIEVNVTVAQSLVTDVDTDPIQLDLNAGNEWEDVAQRDISVTSNYGVTVAATVSGPLFNGAATAEDGEMTALIGLGQDELGAYNYEATEGTAANESFSAADSTVALPATTTVNLKVTGSADTLANTEAGTSGTITITVS